MPTVEPDLSRLLDELTASTLFDDVTPADLAVARDHIAAVDLDVGDVLVRRGEGSTDIYVVVTGELEVELDGDGGVQQLAVLGAGDVVGEIGLLAGGGRSATVRARTRAGLVSLSPEGLRAILAQHPEQGERIARRASERLRRTQLVEHFRATFGTIDGEALATIEGLMSWVHLRAGDQLIEEGERGDAAYLVATGRLSVCRRDAATGAELKLGVVGRGDVLGELALLDDRPRSASAYAVRDTSVIKFTRAAYDELLERYPRVGLEIAKVAIRRSSGVVVGGGVRSRSFAVAAITPDVDVTAFVCELTAALGADACSVSATSLDDELGRAGATQIGDDDIGLLRLAYALEAIEDRYQHVVYELDPTTTPWSRRALRWADEVVLVADATRGPSIGDHEAELWSLLARQRHPRVRLVLLHPADTRRPSGTRAWLDGRAVAAHHHVRRGERTHVERLARLLAGTGVSVVLGGGGARGLGHLGALRAMEELGIPIDMVGGTSIGSIMGVQPGMGLTIDEVEAAVASDFAGFADYTLPVAALLRGRRMTATLQKHFGDVDITDLWVPYFCVGTNLTDACVEYIDRGPLATAVRASISIPGVLPPVPWNGRLYVDGGIIDNVPVEEMRRRNPTGTVIAVDVSPDDGPCASEDYGQSVAGLHALRARRRGGGPPSLMATMMRSSLVASAGQRDRVIREGLADLYLELPVECANPLDFSIADRVIPAATDSARRVLAPWSRSRHERNEEPPMPVRARATPVRPPLIDPARRRRRRGVLLLTVRDLQLRATRFGAVVLGIAVVLTLLFLMTGLTEQFHREPRETVDAFGAEQWLVRDGASGAFTSAATMPADVAADLSGASASPIVLARHSILDGSDATDIVVVGFQANGLGEPDLEEGSLPDSGDEVVVDGAAGLGVGDRAVIGSREYVVSGLTDGRTMFAGMPLVYVPIAEAQSLVYRDEPLATAVLLDGVPIDVPDGFQLLAPSIIAEDALRPLERSISSVNLIRILLWCVAALIIGTMTYLSALERRRDVAVLKAVGASTTHLGASIALQGVLIALVAAAVATAMQAAVAPVFPLDVSVPSRALVQVPAIAIGVSLLAGIVGLRKAIATDPALAFSGPGS